MLTIPPETAYSDVELEWIGSEPANRFPLDQSSLWGQARKVFADYLQTSIVDKLDSFERARQIANCPVEEIHNWEVMLGLPVNEVAPLAFRRALMEVRAYRGPFTRTQRRKIVETFIVLTLGEAISFTPGGVAFTPEGIPFYSGETDVMGTYNIIEDIPNFTYTVNLLATIGVDIDSLTRELERVTTAPITFTINEVPNLIDSAYGAGAYGTGDYGD